MLWRWSLPPSRRPIITGADIFLWSVIRRPRSRHGHHDLPEILSCLHDAVGLADFGERNLRIHDGRDLLFKQGLHPAFHEPGDDGGLLDDRLWTQRETEHPEPLVEDRPDIDVGMVGAENADGDHAAE